jgi:2-polyprenyl-3-methyl-5-hydroxy-6-metoxy-1,4-benzoquinol methylase
VAEDESRERKILESWYKNMAPWIQSSSCGEIESRNLVINNAIVNAVPALAPKTVLDIGCGVG